MSQHSNQTSNNRLIESKLAKLELKVKRQLEENSLLLTKLQELSKTKGSLPSLSKLIDDPSLDLDSLVKEDEKLKKDFEKLKSDLPLPSSVPIKKIVSQLSSTEISESVNQNNDYDDSKPEEKLEPTANEVEKPVIPILLFACNRVTVNKALDLLIAYRPDKEQFPIIVTQDCGHKETANVISSYGDQLIHIKQPDLSEPVVPPKEKKFRGYFKIARHYGWALNQTFNEFGHKQVIIVEDDLEVSPDFYEYFLATLPLLRQDPSLLCVSAWNDNGKAGLIDEEAVDKLYRTDFFPGLGWMMTSETWSELGVKWPRSYWDDWLREPVQRRDRSCIRPEISRSKTFGKVGVSNGLFYEKHLKYIVLSQKFVGFTVMDLSFLTKKNYDDSFVKTVYETPVVSLEDLRNGNTKNHKAVRLNYHTKEAYKKSAKALGIMDDFKSGVPRMAYRGIVSFMHKGQRVYLAPNINWKGYDPKWS